MKALRENLSTVCLCVFEVLVGVLLLIDPIGFTSGIIITFGIVLLFLGAVQTVRYIRTEPQEAAAEQLLLKGLALLVSGLFCVIRSEWFVITFPILTILYGIAILTVGLFKVQATADMLRLKKGRWTLMGISALLSLICAALILYNPFGTTEVLWKFTAITLIVEAIFDLVALVLGVKRHHAE